MSTSNEERLKLIRKAGDDGIKLRRTVIEEHAKAIGDLASRISAVIGGGHKVLVCGNGGSAADSSHLVAELVVRLTSQRNRTALPAISLTADSAIITATGNDYGYERIFARQVEALGAKGDMLLTLSTSGKSPNLLLAVEAAQKHKMITAGLLGGNGGHLLSRLDSAIVIPHDSTQRIQEEHKFLIHTLVELVEMDLFG